MEQKDLLMKEAPNFGIECIFGVSGLTLSWNGETQCLNLILNSDDLVAALAEGVRGFKTNYVFYPPNASAVRRAEADAAYDAFSKLLAAVKSSA